MSARAAAHVARRSAGPGHGRLTRRLKEVVGDGRVVALDLHPAVVALPEMRVLDHCPRPNDPDVAGGQGKQYAGNDAVPTALLRAYCGPTCRC